MKNSRRNFFKITGLAGLGVAAGGIIKTYGRAETIEHDLYHSQGNGRVQLFNMSGYAAPKLEKVRIGFIGLGMRGPNHLRNTSKLEGVEIKALCDVRREKALEAKKLIDGLGHDPEIYSGSADAWKKMCDRKDIDLIYIATPWDQHTPMAVYAMNHGKHVCIEVPAATTVQECWQLVETSERTRKHCMMMENCCYDFFELLTLNMARQGLFGEIVHTEGAYIHNLLDLNFKKESDGGYWNMWRLRENDKRNGNLYPTHGLGPICQVMDINRGDKMEYLVSTSGIDFQMAERAKELAANDGFFKPFANTHYRGNMNTTTIRTHKGKTIMVQHDVTSPNVYSRIHKIVGTKGSALKYPEPGRIATSHAGWLNDQDMKSMQEKYQPAIVKKVGELAKQVGGHGGMDFLMDWRTIDCLRNGLPLDQDVYDAALWSAIAPLSELSVANRSKSIDVPDFTGGSWKKNQPLDISLERGGTTKAKI
ncbi:MAG TPA: Gfo/Idh/MocA family oxidoreductase [Chitinophagaceae bacterium]|nr:Gfo/Idh/MocA family oxidoreductase [Chitinophagaceae bacterium]